MMRLLGIDIGGTKISLCIGDKKGKIQKSKRIKTPIDAGKGIDEIYDLMKEITKDFTEIDAIGISSPGPISVSKGKILTPPNLPGWAHTPIVKLLKKRTEARIFLNNDANAQALAEYHFGKRKGTKNLIYLTEDT